MENWPPGIQTMSLGAGAGARPRFTIVGAYGDPEALACQIEAVPKASAPSQEMIAFFLVMNYLRQNMNDPDNNKKYHADTSNHFKGLRQALGISFAALKLQKEKA